MINNSVRAACGFALAVAFASAAWAVVPGRWVHTSEADFAPGQTRNTVVTNLGDVKLSAGIAELAPLPESISIIHDLQPLDGALYVAAGPEAALLRLEAGQLDEQIDLPGEQLFALDVTQQGRLLLALSGTPSRLAELTPDGPRTLIELPDVRYIWDVLVDGDTVYLATGDEGRLLMVDLAADAPEAVELLDAAQANLLCLGRDGKGNIYAGSDTDGLVYRIRVNADAGDDQPRAQVFVIYDAPEPEIGALLVLEDGTVFVGTADAEQARPGRLSEAVSEEAGRPTDLEAPVQPVEPPQPPDMPGEPPAEPPEPGDLPQVPPEPGPIAPQGDEANDHAAEAEPKAAFPIALAAQAAPADAPADVPASPEATPTQVTPEQRDRLRQVIRRQLEDARRTGTLQQRPGVSARGLAGRARSASAASAGQRRDPQQTQEGNAIYRIGPDGFVSQVFRESVMILRILRDPANPDRLLVGTGSEGEVFRVDVAAEETTMIADLEPQQTPAMAVAEHNGEPVVYIGTANPATLARLERNFAEEGAYTSPILDASQVSLWGKLLVIADVPRDTGVAVQTRSGNVQDPEQAAWSEWSEPHAIEHDPDAQPLAPYEITVQSPPARFLQYRLTFRGDGQATTAVERVELAYVTPNLRPTISSITINNPNEIAGEARGRGGPAGPSAQGADQQRQTARTVEWEASDANGDRLIYTLEYRAAGATRWLPLAKDLTETTYEWQTLRVPDGRYVLRVTASDAPDNPADMARSASRQSDPVVIDNTPPAFENVQVQPAGAGRVRITARVRDNLSPIVRVQYAIDGEDQWQALLPEDMIYDSTDESIRVTIGGLSPGQHVVTLRATDAQANVTHEAAIIEVN